MQKTYTLLPCFSRLRDGWTLVVGLSALFFFGLGRRPLAVPDEGRYAEIPREMVASGDWLTPHLNGLVYFEKPPLVYWIEALMIRFFGVESTFALRLPIALFALVGCLSLYGFCKRLNQEKWGLWSASILATSLLYFVLARLLILDLVFTVFMTGALLTFWCALQKDCQKRTFMIALYGLCLGAGVMTKGLIGVVLPGGAILFWIVYTRQWKWLLSAFHPVALVVFSCVALPWHILVGLKNPGFWSFYFLHEHFARYLTDVHHRTQPFWFFLPVLLLGLFPWITLFPDLLRRRHRLEMPGYLASYLWIAMGWVFFFYSMGSSKLIPYVLPIFPLFALLAGRLVTTSNHLRYSWISYGILTSLFGLGFIFYIPLDQVWGKTPYDLPALFPWIIMGALCLGGGITGVCWWRRTHPYRALLSMGASSFCFLLVLSILDPAVQRAPSIKPLMKDLRSLLSSDTPVMAYDFYPQDVPVYLERTIQVVNHRGELDFGASQDPSQTRLITEVDFWKMWDSPQRVFVIFRHNPQDEYDAYARITKKTSRLAVVKIREPYILGTNYPLDSAETTQE